MRPFISLFINLLIQSFDALNRASSWAKRDILHKLFLPTSLSFSGFSLLFILHDRDPRKRRFRAASPLQHASKRFGWRTLYGTVQQTTCTFSGRFLSSRLFLPRGCWAPCSLFVFCRSCRGCTLQGGFSLDARSDLGHPPQQRKSCAVSRASPVCTRTANLPAPNAGSAQHLPANEPPS